VHALVDAARPAGQSPGKLRLMWLGAATSPGCAKGPDEALPRVRDAVGAVVVSRFTWNIPRTAATGIFTAPFVVR